MVVAAGSAVGLTRASVTATGAFPWTPTSSTPTPVVRSNQVSFPGGLANTRTDLEKTYGRPRGLKGTMFSFRDGAIAATFSGSRATQILVTFATPVTDLDQARTRVKAFAPPDSVLLGTMDVGPSRVADIFHSDRLASQLVALHPNDPSGQYVIIYEADKTGAIKDALLAVGGVPSNAA